MSAYVGRSPRSDSPCPVTVAATFSGSSGGRLPRQATCRSGRSSRRSWPYTWRGASSGMSSTASGAPEVRRASSSADVSALVRPTRARPRARIIDAEAMLGPAGNGAHDRGIDVAVAELGADHLVRLGLLDAGDAHEVLTRGGAFGRVLANVRPVLRVPLAPSEGSVARGADVALADLPPLGVVRVEQRGPAPSLQGRRELPGKIDRVADAGVHAETAGRYDQVDSVAGEEHAPIPITVRQQQVLPPRGAGEHLVLHRNCDGALEHRLHVVVLLDQGVQGEVLRRVLHYEKSVVAVGDVIVAPLAGAVADGDALEQLVAAIQRLAQLEYVVFAAQLDAELLAHGAPAAVAAHHVRRADRAARAICVLHARGDSGLVLGK